METAIVIIGICFVVLTICGISTSCESSRNKYRIRDLETEVEHLKDTVNENDKFVDKTFDGLVDCTKRIDALGKRINSLKHTLETSLHYDGYRPIYCDGSTCINPYCDCINCPRWVIKEGNKTISDRTEFKDK